MTKKNYLGFKLNGKTKDLIKKFSQKSGFDSVSDFLRETALEKIRANDEFSFKGQLDAELNRLQTKAEKQAEKQVLGNDCVLPETYERKIQEEKSKLEKLQDQLKKVDRNTTQAIKDRVAREGSLDDVEDPTWELERKINKTEITINKLKELKTEAQKLQNQVKDRSSEIFEKLVKKELVKEIAEEAESALSKLIEDLVLLDELMDKTKIYRKSSIGWRIQARLQTRVPFFDRSFGTYPRKEYLDDSVSKILNVN